MRSPKMFVRLSFCSDVSIRGTTCSQTWRTLNTSRRIPWQLPTEIPTTDENLVHSFLLSIPTIHRTRSILLHLLALRASTTGIVVKTLASNMQVFVPFIHLEFFIALSLHPCCKMVNISAGDFCKKKILFSSCCHFQHQHDHTHNKQTNKQKTNTVMPLEFIKWRNYYVLKPWVETTQWTEISHIL